MHIIRGHALGIADWAIQGILWNWLLRADLLALPADRPHHQECVPVIVRLQCAAVPNETIRNNSFDPHVVFSRDVLS